MKKDILCLTMLLIMMNSAHAQTRLKEDISCQQAMELIKKHSGNTNFVILDVRTPEEFNNGYLEKAILIDYKSANFQDKISRYDKNKKYLVYCRGGVRSLGAVEIMKNLNFKNLYQLYEGIELWKKIKYKIEFENYSTLETYILEGLNKKDYNVIIPVLWNSLNEYPQEEHHLTNFLLLCYENIHDYKNYLNVLDYSISKEIVSAISPGIIDSLHQYSNANRLIQTNDSLRKIKWAHIGSNFHKKNHKRSGSVIQVTYIGNCGYLIETTKSKILMDAIFNFPKVEFPDSATLHKIINNQEPFDGIDMVFVTHNHPDHCNLKLLDEVMRKNQNVNLVCPEQLLNELKKQYDVNSYENHISAVKYDVIMASNIEIGNVKIKAFNGDHAGSRFKSVNNVNYYIQLDNVKIFHSGDSEPSVLKNWTGTQDFPLDVDIAFLRNTYSDYNLQKQMNSLIKADNQVYMHIDQSIKNMIITNLVNNIELYNNPYIFNELNETIFFEDIK